MEDQDNEWENQVNEVQNGSWIWNKGLALGKKLLITGIVISSAPVVIPPLMVISAVGLACSVPYGIFLASYACTEKLMSTLLPAPVQIPQQKYGAEDAGFEDDVMENEDDPLIRRAKIRLERDEKDYEEKIELKSEGKEENEEPPTIEQIRNEGVEIRGITIEIEGSEETGSNVVDEEVPLEVKSISIQMSKEGDEKEYEELEMETTELVEKLRDEGAGEEKQSAQNVNIGAEEGLEKDDKNAVATLAQGEDKNAGATIAQSGEKNADKNSARKNKKGGRKAEQNGHKTNGAVKSAPTTHESAKKEDKSAAGVKATPSGGKTQNKKANNSKQNLKKDEEIPVSSNEDAREREIAATTQSKDSGESQGTKRSSHPDSEEVILGETPSKNGPSSQ